MVEAESEAKESNSTYYLFYKEVVKIVVYP